MTASTTTDMCADERREIESKSVPEALGVQRALEELGMLGRYVGIARVDVSWTLIESPMSTRRRWLIGDRIMLRPCGTSVVAALGRRGFDLDPDSFRLAFRMPRDWRPGGRMVLTWPRILPPGVEDVGGLIGVPVHPLASGWAAWIAVDLDRSPFDPRQLNAGRSRSRWRPPTTVSRRPARAHATA